MSHSQSFEALVLKTYDVGEADRFCVLFTRERGRIMARASGARRLTSKLGGSLLPFQHLTVDLKEGSAGWIIAGAVRHQPQESAKKSISTFTMLEEGIEILLRLVTDEGALPEVFEVTKTFMQACHSDIPHASLAYSFALLHHLGFMPEESDVESMMSLTPVDHAYLQSCCSAMFNAPESDCDLQKLFALRTLLLDGQISSPLRSGEVIEAMR